VSTRSGFALVVALLLTVTFAAIGAGMLAVAAREAEVSSAMAERSRARAVAESAVRLAFAGWSTRQYRELAVGEEVAWQGDSADDPVLRVRRLDAALFLVAAVASVPGRAAPATATAAVLVRTLDTEALAAGFLAAVMAESEARVRAGGVAGGDACGGGAPVAGIMAPLVVAESGATVAGVPAIAIDQPPPLPSPEVFAPLLLDRMATVQVGGGNASPRPRTEDGACVPDSLNWGAVSPLSPCNGLLPLVRSDADLELRNGEGRGMIVVDGDLELEGFRFHGILLVRGRLTVGPGSVIRGGVRADVFDMLDGSISYDACALADAVTAGGLDGAFRPGERWWLPVW
jgi:hypothetical protein